MDGLIKGLINVALGQDDRDEERSSEPGEERSRSSWAQVVSGEQDNDEPRSDRRHGNSRNQWNREEPDYGRTEQWESGGSRPPIRPQKTVQEGYARNEDSVRNDYNQGHWNRKDEEEKNDDDWHTIGKNPPRQSHKVQMKHWNEYKRPSSEQEYSVEIEYGVNLEPSEEDLADLSKACNKLWELEYFKSLQEYVIS